MSKQNTTATQINALFGGNMLTDAVYNVPAIANTFHKTRQSHSSQMVRNPVRGKTCNLRDFTDCIMMTDKGFDDLYPVLVSKYFHCFGALQRTETHSVTGGSRRLWRTASVFSPLLFVLCDISLRTHKDISVLHPITYTINITLPHNLVSVNEFLGQDALRMES